MRTHGRRPASAAAASARRARPLSSGATPSSRSTTTTSATDAATRRSRSDAEPGTSSHERASPAGTADAVPASTPEAVTVPVDVDVVVVVDSAPTALSGLLLVEVAHDRGDRGGGGAALMRRVDLVTRLALDLRPLVGRQVVVDAHRGLVERALARQHV